MPSQDEIATMLNRTYPPNLQEGDDHQQIAQSLGAQYDRNATMIHPDQNRTTQGRDNIVSDFAACFDAIPDLAMTHADFVFNQDGTVDTSWVITGTHLGEYQGTPPSNQSIRITGRERFYLNADQTSIRRHELWTSLDSQGWSGVIVDG